MQSKLLIAVDGPSASGKGTLCKNLANHFNLPYLNTGGLYRAVTYKAIQNNINFEDIQKLKEIAQNLKLEDVDNPKIFTEEIGISTSIIAKYQDIRDILYKYQINFANQNPKGAILDGRDIGTTICPNANYKFFIIASTEERANRRFKEMKLKNQNPNYDDILNKIKERDERDMNRENSPFKMAKDAILIDTTNKNIDEVFKIVLSYIKEKIN